MRFEAEMPGTDIRTMKHPRRYLALDLGDRRIGLAAGSLEARLAQPLEVLDRAGDEGDARVFRRLRELVKREDIGWIVVGDLGRSNVRSYPSN